VDPKRSFQHSTVTLACASLVGRRLVSCLLLFLLLTGMAFAAEGTPDVLPRAGEIVANPQSAYTFAGWDQLGRMLGLPDEWGLKLGGAFIPEFTWLASGGVDPNMTSANLSFGIHASLDTQKAFCLPGGTLGIEFFEYTGGAVNDAAGSVQQFTNFDGPPPRTRQELMQLWWHQRLFDDKLIFHIGKLNGSGTFGSLQVPVSMGDTWRQGGDITNLLFVPVGLNPTLFSRLPAYYNTGYGAVVHLAPTKDFYASFGVFDASGMDGVQTGIRCLPSFAGYYMNIGELGYSWLAGEEKKPGRIGIGGWYQTGKAYTPALTTEDGATGYYLFATQRLWYLHPGVNNTGVIGYFQFAHTAAMTRQVNTYVGAGLSGYGIIPIRLPDQVTDQVSAGIAWSQLNDTPGAGAFFYPNVASTSNDLRSSEFMFQTVYQMNFFFPLGRGFWSLHPVLGYTYIPTPGQRPDLPPAHIFSLRLLTLF
jgi:porin